MEKVLDTVRKSFSYLKYRSYLHTLPKPEFKNRSAVLFFMHPYLDFKAGGILSLYFILENSKNILKNAEVLPITIARFPKYTKAAWFNNDFNIYNLNSLKGEIATSKSMLVHVPDCFFVFFCEQIKEYGLSDLASRMKVNILNQNQLYMPKEAEVLKYKKLFASITMTMAFKANTHESFSYLTTKPYFLSAWFYGYTLDKVSFEEKEEICVISPDEHPLKKDIVRRLEENCQLKCIEVKNMPYNEFQMLHRRAKWSVTFGEGYDNYFAGAFLKSGIGFSVYNKTFFPDTFDADNLPKTVFASYDDMIDNLHQVITQLNNKQEYEEYVLKTKEIILKHSSPDMVVSLLETYYSNELKNAF